MGTETDEPDKNSVQDHHLCESMAAVIKRKISGFDSFGLPLHLLSFAIYSPQRSVETYGGWSDSAGTVGDSGIQPGYVWLPSCCRQVGQCGTASAFGDAWNGHSHHVLVKSGFARMWSCR